MASYKIRDELDTAHGFGPEAFDMLTRIFRQELRRFPILGHADSSDDLAIDFYADRIGTFPMALAATHDDDAAGKLTRKWARNWLIDRARQTPFGALRNRVEKRLERSEVFTRSAVEHFWRLAEGPDEDFGAHRDQLRRIAADSEVRVQVSEAGKASIGRSGELEGLLRRLLLAAGRLHITDITEICAERFPTVLETGDALIRSETNVDGDQLDVPSRHSEDPPEPGAAESVEHRARLIVATLSDRQRGVLLRLDDVAAVSEHLALGRSSAYNAIADVRSRLRELTSGMDDETEVLAAAIGLALDETADVPSFSND